MASPGRQKKPRSDWVDRLQYLGLRMASMMMHCWPVEFNLRLAQMLGNLVYRIDAKHRQRAIGNLTRSFPQMPKAQIEQMARRTMQQLFMLFVEVMFTTRLIHLTTWRKYFELRNFETAFNLLMRKKQSVILVTGHYGNWEIFGYLLATLGLEMVGVARPLDNPYVNDWLLGVREKRGQKVLAKKGATAQIPQLLKDGTMVAFIADQNAGRKGMFVDFFGRKASTYKSIGLLAMEFRTPIIVGYARRKEQPFRFCCGVQDIIWPKDWEQQEDPLRYITQRYTKGIEDAVRDEPGQYWWVHRRWKTRPKGELPEKYD
jgi:KDO2-lipid IV(A) lauroyltransferase